eukprot:SAG31_NODE_17373_length_673_cov_1.083624_2_plen_82_part_00
MAVLHCCRPQCAQEIVLTTTPSMMLQTTLDLNHAATMAGVRAGGGACRRFARVPPVELLMMVIWIRGAGQLIRSACISSKF